ncbi:MAG: helix-turn-helix domain-containing protein [Taibaiella sp.]|nr:helix-turn-helix domain-containing protein [Taibaiella sp.]
MLEKIKDARKEKGFSHENMAFELGISQAAYSNIEKNSAKLTLERFLKMTEILEKPVYYFFESTPNKVYNQTLYDSSYGHIENMYQNSKDLLPQLTDNYEKTIQLLKDEVHFLRRQLETANK